MSNTIGGKVRFSCTNDCNSMGCPSHEMHVVWHNTSDTLTFFIDDEPYLVTDDDTYVAMEQAFAAYPEWLKTKKK